MHKFKAAVLGAGAVVLTIPAMAADLPDYNPPIEIPDVDDGYGGAFYLRGSAGLGLSWARELEHTTTTPTTFDIDEAGWGYSVGAGIGFETGTGFRADVTVDYLGNEDMAVTIPGSATGVAPGVHTLSLRSTVALANIYYDFGLSGDYGVAGGMFGYVGAGAGLAFNNFISNGPGPADTRDQNTSLAAAGMVGVGYDFGSVVADLGYRGLYINKIENDQAAAPYTIHDTLIHEVRGTVRYRF